MSLVQRLVLFFLSRERAAAIEAEARSWVMRCAACGRASSVWDMGGVRYGAAGKPYRVVRCPNCDSRMSSTLTKVA